jgi:hypothetical protein
MLKSNQSYILIPKSKLISTIRGLAKKALVSVPHKNKKRFGEDLLMENGKRTITEEEYKHIISRRRNDKTLKRVS